MSDDPDAALASLLLGHVHDLLAWLDDYPADQVRAGAVAELRRSVDGATGQPAPAGSGAALATATGLLVDVMWWLDTCADEDVDPHVAVKLQESTAACVDDLPQDRRARLLEVLDRSAARERHDARRYELRLFPYAIGLTEDEPDEAGQPAVRQWVPPERRGGGDVTGTGGSAA